MPGEAGGGASACSSPASAARAAGARTGEATAAGSRPAPVNCGDLCRRRPGMGRGHRDQARRRLLAVLRAAHRSARPRQAERPPAGNPPPSPGRCAPLGSTGRLVLLADSPHLPRVTPRGGKQQWIWDNQAGRSPDSSRQILRAIGAEQHLRTSAPYRAVRPPRHVPDLPAGELPLQLAPALTVPHGLSPSSTPISRRQTRCGRFRSCQSTTPRQPQLTGACSRKPTGTRQALRRAAPEASDPFSGTAPFPR
jgi:hypothetical protein